MKSAPGTMKPPSPWIGSSTMQAMFGAPMCLFISTMACSAHASPHNPGDAPAAHR
jgi:hypothetical protein